MPKAKKLDGGSIESTLTVWFSRRDLLRGIKDSKEFTFLLIQSLKKVSIHLPKLNLRKVTSLKGLYKKVKESAQVLNLLVRKHLETETLNGAEMMWDMELLTRGYIGIMDMRLPVKTGSRIY